MGISLIEEASKFDALKKQLKWLKNHAVYVGISDDTTKREEEEENKAEVTNAELLFIHTNGSPKMNIPPRPVIEPALKDDRKRLSKMLGAAANKAMEGQEAEAEEQLEKVGIRGQNVSRAWFVNPKNNWPPDKQATIKAKMKGKPKGYEPRTLIDTAQMRNAIHYFVDK